MTKAEAERALKAFLDSVTDVLTKGDSVTFVGFGTFAAVDVPERSGKIPGTDKTYTKPAHKTPKFKAGKSLKEAVEKAN